MTFTCEKELVYFQILLLLFKVNSLIWYSIGNIFDKTSDLQNIYTWVGNLMYKIIISEII